MSNHITVKLKDGTKHIFEPQYRAGGSYSNGVRYEGWMLVVFDEFGKETAFPVQDVILLEKIPTR